MTTIAGIQIPDSALAKATTEYIRDVESDLLYHHSRRVFLFGALSGERKQLAYNPELLYVGAMFHDLGLVEGHRSDDERFEVDGAMPPRQTIANTISTKYSAGPKAIAHLASSGANSTMPHVAIKAPMKELQADKDNAFALGLPPESALILLAAVYLGCEYGGRISSILLNIPGEASTVMTKIGRAHV